MTDLDSASRQLRVIRSLMERATIYRSLSAPTALVGGLLSLGGFAVAYYARHYRHQPLSDAEFLVVWLVILVLTGLTNAYFLSREARRREQAFFSSGMKCALQSLAPAFLLAGVLTICISAPILLAFVWITLYGLGLLATQQFAPRSIVVLGMCFFVVGGALCAVARFVPMTGDVMDSPLAASWLMAATFGGFHLAYAALVWALGEERSEAPAPSTGTENV
jgi:hypothetical protein